MASIVSVRLSDEEKEQLLKIAEEEYLSLSQVIRKAIREFLATK